jgi:hypothetical protein
MRSTFFTRRPVYEGQGAFKSTPKKPQLLSTMHCMRLPISDITSCSENAEVEDVKDQYNGGFCDRAIDSFSNDVVKYGSDAAIAAVGRFCGFSASIR